MRDLPHQFPVPRDRILARRERRKPRQGRAGLDRRQAGDALYAPQSQASECRQLGTGGIEGVAEGVGAGVTVGIGVGGGADPDAVEDDDTEALKRVQSYFFLTEAS